LRLAIFGIVAGDRLGAAIAHRREAARGQAAAQQIVGDRLRALFRQRLIGILIAIGIGVAGNLDVGGGTAQRRLGQAVEQPERVRRDIGASRFEADTRLRQQVRE